MALGKLAPSCTSAVSASSTCPETQGIRVTRSAFTRRRVPPAVALFPRIRRFPKVRMRGQEHGGYQGGSAEHRFALVTDLRGAMMAEPAADLWAGPGRNRARNQDGSSKTKRRVRPGGGPAVTSRGASTQTGLRADRRSFRTSSPAFRTTASSAVTGSRRPARGRSAGVVRVSEANCLFPAAAIMPTRSPSPGCRGGPEWRQSGGCGDPPCNTAYAPHCSARPSARVSVPCGARMWMRPRPVCADPESLHDLGKAGRRRVTARIRRRIRDVGFPPPKGWMPARSACKTLKSFICSFRSTAVEQKASSVSQGANGHEGL